MEQIIGALWRLRRARRVEAGILENEICGAARAREDEGMPQNDRMMRDMMNPRSAPSAEERRKAVENASAADWGAAFMRDANRGNAFSKLSRYETAIERSFMKSLHELQRLQAARLGGSAPLPVATDVDVSVSTD